jgi:ribose transport system substrate-binding protein
MFNTEEGENKMNGWVTTKRTLLRIVPIAVLLVIASACAGDTTTPTEAPAEPTSAPTEEQEPVGEETPAEPTEAAEATSTPEQVAATDTPEPTPTPDEVAATLAEVEADVEALRDPVAFQAPGPPLDVGDQLQGRTIYFVANGLNFPFVQNMLRGLENAAELVGMEVIAVDGAGQVSEAARLIEQGVGRGVDVIIDEGFPSEQLSEPIRAAQEAGIPVIEFGQGTPQLPPEELREFGVTAWATFCYTCAGTQMAQYAVLDTGGQVNGLIYNVPGISVSPQMTQSITEELERLCPETCSVEVVDAPLDQWSTLLPSQTSSTLERNPDLNYLFPLFDSMIAQIEPAIAEKGAEDRVRIISYNATLRTMQLVGGGDLVAADIGNPQEWIGWAFVDQAIRLLLGEEPLADENIPNRLFDDTNIDTIDLEAPEATWYGADFECGYRELWGFECE